MNVINFGLAKHYVHLIVRILFILGIASECLSENYLDPNSLTGFGGRNRSGFESMTCQNIITLANKNFTERSLKIIKDADLTPEKCKQSTLSKTFTLVTGRESECQKKLSDIIRKMNQEKIEFHKLLKIRMALYDVQYIYGINPLAKDWINEITCEKGYRENAFKPLALRGRPQKADQKTDTDQDLIDKLDGRCNTAVPANGSAITTFTTIANQLYASKGLSAIAKDRAQCQKILDDERFDEIPTQRPRESSDDKKQGPICPPVDRTKCQENLYTNSAVTGDICKYAQFEECLLNSSGSGRTIEQGTAGSQR